MRIAWLLIILSVLSGCATMTYTSQESAQKVSDCIAKAWRKVPTSGVELPVSLTKEKSYYFVDVVLVHDFPTFMPIHSMWAKVKPLSADSSGGSTTEYHRNFQIWHKKIDSVVETCQKDVEQPPLPASSLQGDGPDALRPELKR
jgi:hypothetical protein